MESLLELVSSKHPNCSYLAYISLDNEPGQMYGRIGIDIDRWHKLYAKILAYKKKPDSEYQEHVQVYRDLENIKYIYDNPELNKQVILQKNTLDIINSGTLLVHIYELKNIPGLCFPILNSYHVETNKIIKSFQFGNISMNFITEESLDSISYIVLDFTTRSEILPELLDNLRVINKIIS